jgi:hypothetical protein
MAAFPRSEGTARPFRLWDANAKKPMRWRYYSDKKRAHMGALIEARWAKIDTTIEVYNANTGRLLGQYTRKVNNVEFMGE